MKELANFHLPTAMKHSMNVHLTVMLGIGVQQNPLISPDILKAQVEDGDHAELTARYLVTYL